MTNQRRALDTLQSLSIGIAVTLAAHTILNHTSEAYSPSTTCPTWSWDLEIGPVSPESHRLYWTSNPTMISYNHWDLISFVSLLDDEFYVRFGGGEGNTIISAEREPDDR